MSALIAGYMFGILWTLLVGSVLYYANKDGLPSWTTYIFAIMTFLVGFGIGPHGFLAILATL